MSRSGRHLRDDQSGAVFAEYLIAFVVQILFFLTGIQLTLAWEAKNAVQEAADYAAGKAAKFLDAPEEEMGGAERNSVSGSGMAPNRVAAALEAMDFRVGGLGMLAGFPGNARHQAIRDAARFKLVPFSPRIGDVADGTNAQRAAHVGWSGMAEREVFTRAGVAVVFPKSPGSTSYKRSFGKNDPVRVRVTYLFHCNVPIVSWVMCRRVRGIVSGLGDLGRTRHLGVLKLRSRSGSLRQAVDLAYVTEPWRLLGLQGRYLLMTAEAERANQAADYDYEGE